VKEEEGSAAAVPQAADTPMPDAETPAVALPNGDAHMANALDPSSALAQDGTLPGAAAAVKAEAEEEQKPEMLFLADGPAVKVLLQLNAHFLASHAYTYHLVLSISEEPRLYMSACRIPIGACVEFLPAMCVG